MERCIIIGKHHHHAEHAEDQRHGPLSGPHAGNICSGEQATEHDGGGHHPVIGDQKVAYGHDKTEQRKKQQGDLDALQVLFHAFAVINVGAKYFVVFFQFAFHIHGASFLPIYIHKNYSMNAFVWKGFPECFRPTCENET